MTKTEEKIEQLKTELAGIEEEVMMRPLTLADVMRQGSQITVHSTEGWGDGESACALHAAAIAAAAHNLI